MRIYFIPHAKGRVRNLIVSTATNFGGRELRSAHRDNVSCAKKLNNSSNGFYYATNM